MCEFTESLNSFTVEKPYTVIPLLLKPCQSINRLGTFQNSLPFEIINILKSLHNSFAI